MQYGKYSMNHKRIKDIVDDWGNHLIFLFVQFFSYTFDQPNAIGIYSINHKQVKALSLTGTIIWFYYSYNLFWCTFGHYIPEEPKAIGICLIITNIKQIKELELRREGSFILLINCYNEWLMRLFEYIFVTDGCIY